jgi:two-component system LytT family response regulator
MKCIIIEDEISGQELLKQKVTSFYPEIIICSIINNKDEAIRFLNENKVDFIFLDIHIIGGSGIDILKSVNNINFEIIFTTAYNEYMPEAFEIGAIHYLMKPFKDIDLKKAIERVYQKYNLKYENNTLLISNKNEIHLIKFTDIIYLKSEGSYTEVNTISNRLISSTNIGEIEKKLDLKLFFRTHHSYIVNKSYIEKIEKDRNGNVLLKNKHNIPISQRKMLEFIKFIEKE